MEAEEELLKSARLWKLARGPLLALRDENRSS